MELKKNCNQNEINGDSRKKETQCVNEQLQGGHTQEMTESPGSGERWYQMRFFFFLLLIRDRVGCQQGCSQNGVSRLSAFAKFSLA